MLSQNEINHLFNQGKQDVLTFVRASYAHETSLLASLQLALNNGDLGIEPLHIRQILIKENYDFLASLSDNDPRLLRVMSVAAGRLTQLKEFKAAIARIALAQQGGVSEFRNKLHQVGCLMDALEGPSIRIQEGGDKVLSLDGMGLPMMPDSLRISAS